MFRKILVANRGEIALRIIRTCKKLKVRTVAVYSEPDVESRHIFESDESFNIGPGEPSESYLNIAGIVRVAKRTGVEAVHPGYGFLAENAEFARACEESGLVFVGPGSRVLGRVANKLGSKRFVAEAGIPVIPGPREEIRTAEEAESDARKIGLPVLIKAVYGGGGRGMRIARTPGELIGAIDRATSEAVTAFGRPELYMEKFLEAPRHIEVQIIAGPRGRIVHLGDRECSLQRRYQKVLEETPSPGVGPKERNRLVSLALKVARASRYENAGTIEFVQSRDGRFYYLETNKRIQVEHLITELVTGVDIVEEQLRVASGEGPSLSQDEVSFSGAAINCRINAEDPEAGFAPSSGRVAKFVAPGGPGVRVDTALYDGCPVPEYYDSLIAKVACLGRGRPEAIQRMRVALNELTVDGVKTTAPIHRVILENELFVRGKYHTQLLDRLLERLKVETGITHVEAAGIYVALKRSFEAGRVIMPVERSGSNRWRAGLQEREKARPALYVEGL